MVLEELFTNEALPYAATFLIFFVLLNFAIKRSPLGENKLAATIIAISISALAVWGLVNYTDLMSSFSGLFDNFEMSLRMIIFFVVIALIIFLIVRGVGAGNLNFGLFAIAAVLIFIYFLPEIINAYYLEYYLPGWLFQTPVKEISLVAGIILGVFSLFRRRWALREISIGNRKYIRR
jgi:hypothetical protein